MQIDRVAGPGALTPSQGVGQGVGQGTAKPGSPGFDALLEATGPRAGAELAAASDIAAAAYTAALDSEVADREARRHGKAMMQALASLQRALLGGGVEDACATLGALAARLPPAHDPVLRLVQREIAARAAAELARMSIPANVSIP